MVSAPARRALVREWIDGGASERCALAAIGMSASALRYRPREDRNVELRERIFALAHRHRRYGVGMISLKLRQEGRLVNYTRVERLYCEQQLQVRRRTRKKVPVGERAPLLRPTKANQGQPGVVDGRRVRPHRRRQGNQMPGDRGRRNPRSGRHRRGACDLGTRRCARAGSVGTQSWPAEDDPHGQWQGVLWQGHGRLGACQSCAATPDPAWQAEPECLRRILQRPATRRMPQRTLVPNAAACAHRDRTLAPRIQRTPPQKNNRRNDAGGLCPAVGQ
ncbi:IS1404 transposase [Xanthomonas oryzae pv. oryzae KACC 10331]|uniref:IS1404 transposase n=1 Tax=Xanthomonas oryzae pv. oryzae (strain KACC10331 / KXO85) TaxID=291331 RepID=Q5H1B0_XANOR|nr:IS1404 transposase [Xanthomonas oryzae pv. oryzae KACC 10331]